MIGPLQRLAYKVCLRRNLQAAADNAVISAERQALLDQLIYVEQQLRNINPLSAGHPALAQEPALLAEAEALRAQLSEYE
jgi:hypothetical protein